MRAFVQLVCLGFACGNSVCAEADGLTRAHDERPNVLFIAVDDLNDWVGFLGGHPQARTPHLDRLAAQGIVFRDAHFTCKSMT